jgi:PAS domain S-box-containing protein
MATDLRPAVLLVDDRTENLVALEAVLAPLNCRLVSATSGSEALKRLLEDDFAVILLDVQMPELDGFETAEYIKRRERTKNIPIIFVTAISKEEHHVFRGYEAGAVDYVFKPYDPVVLRSKVAVFVELWRASRAVRASEEMARATFEDAPIGMARMDREGHIVASNRALTETLGLSGEELAGKTIEELTHPEDRSGDASLRELLLSDRRARYETERRLLAAGGRALPALVSFSVAHPSRGDTALVAHVQDLRERKRAERARELLIREQAARLEAEAVSERLHAIQRIVDAALAPLDLDQLLGELLGRIAEVLSVDGASFVLADPDGGYVVVQQAEGVKAAVQASFTPTQGGPVTHVLGERTPVVVEDASQNEALGEALPGAAVSSTLAVPLLLKDSAIGVLTVGTMFPRAFSDADSSLLQLAADRAALAIERNRLYQREHDTAQQLTKALLLDDAKMPRVPGLRIAKRYLPGGADVGGDWYDALALPGGRLALVMGDVAGRGVPAAASMGQLRSALRAYALEGAGPAEVLRRLNRFQFQLDEDSMATVVMLVLDPHDNRLTWANAGHPPPLLLEPTGPRYLEHRAGGVPLGAIEEPSYVEAEAELPPGSTVILYTDGLVEHPGRPLAEGFDRLLAAAGNGALEPEDLCEAILGGTLGDATSADDVTFIVAHAPAALGGRLSLSLPGEMEGLSSLRAMLRRWLAENAAEPDEVAAVTMATNEAVENAIEHGHRLSPEPFHVDLEVVDGEVVVTVKDRGRWQNNRRAKRGNVKKLDPSERGRGIKLMEAFMDDVDVVKGSAGTTVVLRRKLRNPEVEVV